MFRILLSFFLDILKADVALSNSVSAGAYIAVSECAFQFRFEKWNCPESAFNLNPITSKGTSTHTSTRRFPVPSIPQPSARIGGLKSDLDYQSAIYATKYKDKIETAVGIDGLLQDTAEMSKSTEKGNKENVPMPNQDQENHSKINRETALVRAMTSAGITHTLTKNCSTGDFTNCVCDR